MDKILKLLESFNDRFDSIDTEMKGINKRLDENFVVVRAIRENLEVLNAKVDRIEMTTARIQGEYLKKSDLKNIL